MKRLNLSLDKNKKYVVACSFGPDSMALLDAAIKEGLNIVVAHVNYRKRDAAIYEQKELVTYCQNRNIPIYVLDLINQRPTGNFQAWARKKRYEFFKTVVVTEGAFAVLVAHQQDDLIETYLMQKKRGNFVKTYGISKENEIFGVKVIRPLLGYSKAELLDYDVNNNVPYSIDVSNLTNHYTRNKIRHSVVEKLSEKERREIVNQINDLSRKKVEYKTTFSKAEFLALDYKSILLILDHFMQLKDEHRDISEKFVNEIKEAFKNKATLRIELTKSIWLELGYEDVFVVNASKIKPYKFEVRKTGKNRFIEIDFSSGAEDRGVPYSQNRFTVRNCSKKNKIIIKDYTSEIRRQFIDWKMPLFLREIWPGIYDIKGNLIYVPRYRKNFEDNHKSKFKIDTEYFLKF